MLQNETKVPSKQFNFTSNPAYFMIKDELKTLSSLEKMQENSNELSIVFSGMVLGTAAISSVSNIYNNFLSQINDLSIVLLTTSASVSIVSGIQKTFQKNKIIKNNSTPDQSSKWNDISKKQILNTVNKWLKSTIIAGASACVVYAVPMAIEMKNMALAQDISLLAASATGLLSFALFSENNKYKKSKDLIFNDVVTSPINKENIQLIKNKKALSPVKVLTSFENPSIQPLDIAAASHDAALSSKLMLKKKNKRNKGM